MKTYESKIDWKSSVWYNNTNMNGLEAEAMPVLQKDAARELTLMLMYLTSWKEHDAPALRAVKKKELEQYPLVRRSWKGYDFSLMEGLSADGLINTGSRSGPALITSKGESEALKLLKQYGIELEERRSGNA